MIRHQIGLLRLSGSVQKKILALLDATEKDVADAVKRRLKRGLSVSSQQATINAIKGIRSKAWEKSATVWRDEMRALAQAEPEFLSTALKTVAPVTLDLVIPSIATLNAIVVKSPFEGKVLKEWAKSVAAADIARLEQQIRIGVTQGESAALIARRLVGSVQQGGRNGATEITRQNAAAITRTAINGISNQAKRAFYVANSDLFSEELYVATLDARTTPICQSLDGKFFPIGKGPIPPLHFNCRSLRVASLNGEAIGTRPMNASTRRQLLGEYTKGKSFTAATRDALPRGHKTAFDTFARQRVRELTGVVDAKVTYQEFLTRQSTAFQNEVLGPTRGKLFRSGGLPLTKFVNRQGDELTLAQLASSDKNAFIKAGLNPEDFR